MSLNAHPTLELRPNPFFFFRQCVPGISLRTIVRGEKNEKINEEYDITKSLTFNPIEHAS